MSAFPKGKNSKLEEIMAKVETGDASIRDVLKTASDEYLTQIKLVNNMLAKAALGMKISSGYNDFTKSLVNGDLDDKFEEISEKITATTRAQIEEKVKKHFKSVDTIEGAREAVKKTRLQSQGLTIEEKIDMAQAMYAIYPAPVRELYDAVVLRGSDIETHTRKFDKMTEEEQAQWLLDTAKLAPIDAIVDAAYELTQKATPDALKLTVITAAASLSAKDVKNVVFNGLDFVEDLLKTAKKEDRIGVKNQKKAAEFGQSLSKLFNALVDGAVDAGITPDTDLKAAFAKAKAANDNKDTPPSPKKKGNDGLNF